MTYETIVRLPLTDAAGVVFFARWFELAHLAYEALLDDIGAPLSANLAAEPTLLPVVHAEADYERPIRLGMALAIDVRVTSVRRSSFSLAFTFRTSGGRAGHVRTVHVAMNAAEGKATGLPPFLREKLAARLEGQPGE